MFFYLTVFQSLSMMGMALQLKHVIQYIQYKLTNKSKLLLYKLLRTSTLTFLQTAAHKQQDGTL